MICLPFRTRQGMVSNMSNCLPPPHRVGMSPFSFCTQSFYCHVLCYCWHPGRTPLLTPCRGGRLVVVLVGGGHSATQLTAHCYPRHNFAVKTSQSHCGPGHFLLSFFSGLQTKLEREKGQQLRCLP